MVVPFPDQPATCSELGRLFVVRRLAALTLCAVPVQISVDIFAAASQYLDLFSLAALPRQTAGSLYYYPGFQAPRDGRKLTAEVGHNLGRTTGWEGVMRLRCSKGVRIASFHGHLHVRSNDLVALPSVSSDDTIIAQLALEDSVVAGGQVYMQCAVLYTNSQCERRIRVHTMALPVVGGVFELFEASDALACAGATPFPALYSMQ